MSKPQDAVPDRGDDRDNDCPLCFEQLAPYWDVSRKTMYVCCGKEICKACDDSQDAFLDRAVINGTFGVEELQLGSSCPFCRTIFPADDGTIIKTLQRKFDGGTLPLRMYNLLASSYLDRGCTAKGMRIMLLGAEKGDPECQYNAGHIYFDGSYGQPISPREAKRWLLAAAEQDHAIAEYTLGVMMSDEGDDTKTLRYMRGSAAKGYGDACYNLGVFHSRGIHGLDESVEEAIRVLMPAAERGHALSMGLMGWLMCKPRDMPPPDNPEFVKGMHWARRAAVTGKQMTLGALGELEEVASSVCFNCSKESPRKKTYLRCSRCRVAHYCSKDCQIQHWKSAAGGHKQCCIKA